MGENKEEHGEREDFLMMHTVRSSMAIDEPIPEADGVGEFQNDIALMDAQLANLTAMCNGIQNNYYDMNKRLDESQERGVDMHPAVRCSTDEDRQIGTMEAWSLLQSIQHNLASIDGDMSEMNNGGKKRKIKKHQLKHIKSKSRTKKGKRGKTKAELNRNLQQQSDLLNDIYNKLSNN